MKNLSWSTFSEEYITRGQCKVIDVLLLYFAVATTFESDDNYEYDASANFTGPITLPNGRGQCLTCGKEFFSYSVARRHFINSHAGGRRSKCHLCGKEYKNVDVLKMHLRAVHNIFQKNLPKSIKGSVNEWSCHVKIYFIYLIKCYQLPLYGFLNKESNL